MRSDTKAQSQYTPCPDHLTLTRHFAHPRLESVPVLVGKRGRAVLGLHCPPNQGSSHLRSGVIQSLGVCACLRKLTSKLANFTLLLIYAWQSHIWPISVLHAPPFDSIWSPTLKPSSKFSRLGTTRVISVQMKTACRRCLVTSVNMSTIIVCWWRWRGFEGLSHFIPGHVNR